MQSFKIFVVALCVAVMMLSCNKGANQPGATSQTSTAKRYHLKGKVVSVDKRANMANIDGEDIPGFMGAMTMPYVVKPASELDKLAPGDAITGDIVVQGDDSWLENVTVTGHSAPAAK
jgi:protein SCO1/2